MRFASYERLVDREDAWIMEVRRLSLPQVSLYLGAWILVVGAALIVLFRYPRLSGTLCGAGGERRRRPRPGSALACWRRATPYCAGVSAGILPPVPVALLVGMGRLNLLTAPTHGDVTWSFSPSSRASR